MANSPLVSVVMITFNHEKYLSEAINGVLTQECDFDIELIISDDCSTDKTMQVVEGFRSHANYSWIKYKRHNENIGMTANFNWALAHATGVYIAICEGDDFWTHPAKLKRQVDFLERNISYSACFHDCDIAHMDSNIVERSASKGNLYSVNNFFIEDLIDNVIINTCTILLRRDMLLIPESLKIYLIDRVVFMLAALNGPVRYLNYNMATYRKHNEGFTSRSLTMDDILSIENRWNAFDLFTNSKYQRIIKFQKRKLMFNYFLFREKRLFYSYFYRIKYLDVLFFYLKKKV